MSIEDCILTDSEFRQFRDLIYQSTGIALSDGKRSLIQSRLHKRLRYYQLTRYQDYYDLVVAQGPDGEEMGALINCMTTNKTDFFREPHHFDFVARQIVPIIKEKVARGEAPRKLRIWHAGCSTGEEPYTLALTLAEALKGSGTWDVRQLASDIDTEVLRHAERGVYEMERVAPVSKHLLHTYFLRGRGEKSGLVQVREELRRQITFRKINLLDDVWPMREDTRFDILFCRNVVIYFDQPTRRKLFARFVERLKPGGYLFIGHSESLIGISDAFENMGRTIFRLPETPRAKAEAA